MTSSASLLESEMHEPDETITNFLESHRSPNHSHGEELMQDKSLGQKSLSPKSTIVKTTRRFALLFCATALALAAPHIARAQSSKQQGTQQNQSQSQQNQTPQNQDQNQNQNQNVAPGQQQAPQQNAATPEDTDYKAFYNLKPEDTDDQIKMGEAFVAKYPASKYDEAVYARMTQAYFAKSDYAKMYEDGDKALALNPDDVSVLVRLGWVTPHNSDPNDMDAERKLQKAEEELKHALDVLSTMPKPANMTDDAFTKAKADAADQAHDGLGLVYFREGKYDESVAELQKSTNDSTPGAVKDPTDYYVMGVDLQKLKRNSDAADAYNKCAAMSGPLQARCKQSADQAKAAK